MERVTGIGGVFFKSKDPERLYQWYVTHLGLKREEFGAVAFPWRESADPQKEGVTVWSIFPQNTKYLGSRRSSFMINFRVENLDALLELLRSEGVAVERDRAEEENGRFAWITDPDGNRIELWQPSEKSSEKPSE